MYQSNMCKFYFKTISLFQNFRSERGGWYILKKTNLEFMDKISTNIVKNKTK